MSALAITAIHEAGHAYAVGLRGGTVKNLTLSPGLTTFHLPDEPAKRIHRNEVHQIIKIEDSDPGPQTAFVMFAGPWAEARARYAKSQHGHTFLEYFATATQKNPSDAQAYVESPDLHDWAVELDQHWRAIVELARRLLAKHRANRL